MTARDVMSTEVIFARPDDTLRQAAALMQRHDHRALPVLNEQGETVGIVTETDLLKLLLPDYLQGIQDLGFLPPDVPTGRYSFAEIADLPVSQAMRTDVLCTVAEDEPVVEMIHLIVRYRLDSLPVVRDGRVVGIVTCGDLVRAIVHPALEDSASR